MLIFVIIALSFYIWRLETKGYCRMEQKKEGGTQIPGWNELFSEKLELVIKRYPSITEAANQAGVHRGALLKWRTGRSAPSAFSLAKLCQGSGLSMDWLLSEASDPELPNDDIENRPIDKETLKGAVEGLENYLSKRSLSMEPRGKAETIYALYMLILIDEMEGRTLLEDSRIDAVLSAG